MLSILCLIMSHDSCEQELTNRHEMHIAVHLPDVDFQVFAFDTVMIFVNQLSTGHTFELSTAYLQQVIPT